MIEAISHLAAATTLSIYDEPGALPVLLEENKVKGVSPPHFVAPKRKLTGYVLWLKNGGVRQTFATILAQGDVPLVAYLVTGYAQKDGAALRIRDNAA
jgi:hypothetical protein